MFSYVNVFNINTRDYWKMNALLSLQETYYMLYGSSCEAEVLNVIAYETALRSFLQ